MENHLDKNGDSTPKIPITRRALECIFLFTSLGYIQLVIKDWFSLEGGYLFLYIVCWAAFNSTTMCLYFAYRQPLLKTLPGRRNSYLSYFY
ncbi:hypothetical protein BDV26DRAFT_265685 [Aspergillus bertholletiae]|uniref:Uncharacterized protein n=1 Tax=Aspergillus bertholletiae TaxID=1226010 RepID=A0A5N7B4W7_9EURO|nr:hypothetical protein BDV26DRAFT_265685 [Aspergillus bertholletiae]